MNPFQNILKEDLRVMKTNLKKAISAVCALALASSLAPATFAAKLTLSDVADTASYATAVNTLVALNVINGYEDGTFLPDNDITRAEATKVMVAALNQLESAEGMKGSTKFTDVEAKHEWATGFINAGVQEGYINGMGDGTFAPDAKVTYAQMVKMLVSALGYDEYAEFMGGYPNGYLSIANSEGVTAGVKANAEDAVSRAQVAQLVYNALTTPIVKSTGMRYTDNGTLVPSISKMDGENNFFKTILTEKFDAYYVEGYVTATAKSAAIKNDEVNFGIARSERYDNSDFGLDYFVPSKNVQDYATVTATGSNRIKTVKLGDTDADQYEGVYATAIIMVDEYDDNVLVSYIPSGKNKTLTFDADLYDADENTEFDAASNPVNYLNIFSSESATKPTKYSIKTTTAGAPELTVYVNGEKVNGYPGRTAIKNYLASAVGEVTLVDTYKTDGYYDTLYLNRYTTVQVSTVLTSQNKIIFTNTSSQASLVLDPDDENLVYNIYLDGEKIELSELKEDDVLSIAYIGSNFNTSSHYDIYVSREVVTGKLGGISTTDKTVTIGGTEYKFFNNPATLPLTSQDMGNEYTVYVDYFGRIYKHELNLSTAKYAVLDKAVDSTSDENLKLTMYTADGESKTVILDGSKATIKVNGTAQTYGTSSDTAAAKKLLLETDVKSKVYSTGTTRNAINTRIVKYKISNSTGRVIELDFITGTQATGTYKSSTGAIGSAKIGDATKIIDATKYITTGTYSDIKTAAKNTFVTETNYTVYSYGAKVDGYHPFVLVTVGQATYNADTRFAVIADGVSDEQDEAGDPIYVIPALYFDAEAEDNTVAKRLIVSDDIERTQLDNLQVGDIIVFTTDAKGYIDGYSVIFDFSVANATDDADLSDYSQLVSNALVNENYRALFTSQVVNLPSGNRSTDWVQEWSGYSASITEPIQLVFGPVVTSNSKSVGIGMLDNNKTDLNHNEKDVARTTGTGSSAVNYYDGVYEIDLDSDTAVYEYDYSQSKKNRLSVSTAASIRPSVIVNKDASGNAVTDDTIHWDNADNKLNVNFAFALVVDGTARDVLVFNAK